MYLETLILKCFNLLVIVIPNEISHESFRQEQWPNSHDPRDAPFSGRMGSSDSHSMAKRAVSFKPQAYVKLAFA